MLWKIYFLIKRYKKIKGVFFKKKSKIKKIKINYFELILFEKNNKLKK